MGSLSQMYRPTPHTSPTSTSCQLGSSLMMFYPRLSLLHVSNNRNYDVYGASSTPGPNAPLGNLCNRSARSQYSAEAAFKQWTAAGFPAKQLLLGLPLYGYVSDSTKTSLTENFSIAMEEPQQVGAMN